MNSVDEPNAKSSVAFSCAPQPARRTDWRTSPQRAPQHEQLNVDCSEREAARDTLSRIPL